jgi:pyruvate carboxylase
MYPKVFLDFAEHHRLYGDVSVLPTLVFYYGLDRDEELAVDIERGKTLIIRLLAVGEPDEEGNRTVFFELNGQPREVKVADHALAHEVKGHRKADEADPSHVAAPMPGLVVSLSVQPGQHVQAGDRLLSIEAMKMETGVFAERAGRVDEVLVSAGSRVDTKDLLLVLGDPDAPGAGDTAQSADDAAGERG